MLFFKLFAGVNKQCGCGSFGLLPPAEATFTDEFLFVSMESNNEQEVPEVLSFECLCGFVVYFTHLLKSDNQLSTVYSVLFKA